MGRNSCEACKGAGQIRCATCDGLGSTADTFHPHGTTSASSLGGVTSLGRSVTKRDESAPTPGMALDAAIKKQKDIRGELQRLADENAKLAHDFSPYAREVATARVLRTPEGRALYDQYERACREAQAAVAI